jgi:hypothetical protein
MQHNICMTYVKSLRLKLSCSFSSFSRMPMEDRPMWRRGRPQPYHTDHFHRIGTGAASLDRSSSNCRAVFVRAGVKKWLKHLMFVFRLVVKVLSKKYHWRRDLLVWRAWHTCSATCLNADGCYIVFRKSPELLAADSRSALSAEMVTAPEVLSGGRSCTMPRGRTSCYDVRML